MFKKIKKELDAKIEVELSDIKKDIANLKSYILKNEDTEKENIMIKVLTSKNTLKRLVKELPKFEERDKNATDTANNLLSSANEIKLNKIILAELEAMENHLLPIIETLATGEHEQVAACFNYVLYGMGTKFFANQDNDTGYKNVILDKSMKNIQREKENLKRKISESENFLQGYPKINKLLKAM